MKYIKTFLESQGPKKINFEKLEMVDPETQEKFLVYRGKNAEANDHITFELGQEGDYWFHAAEVPGSHCLMKVRDTLPSKSLIYQVAHLTAKNSKTKTREVMVHWVKREFVFKKEGMKQGQVEVDPNNINEVKVFIEE